MGWKTKLPRHLVLDLDETLIHSIPASKAHGMEELLATLSPEERKRVFKINVTARSAMERMEPPEIWYIIKRPHLESFLQFCFQNFETVSVWTAAYQLYAEAIVEEIFRTSGRPTLLWHRSMCKPNAQDDLTKPLMEMAQALRAPVDSVCILDDSSVTFQQNISSAIWMPKWMPKVSRAEILAEDDILARLMVMWTLQRHNEVKQRNDVAIAIYDVQNSLIKANLGYTPIPRV